mmetsp:Transcript_11717/g.23847  ORF Transcript_11717/g.23847 Transcript_11717/m.23847 type:complete len:416 (-) Transcript_11717:3064-4311(-)|eukprot:CAMPEP_0184690286 /NCGR_PEP_ID=MMETSP0312-20130426/31138_1 /TAXON_ID=31354 /ORGANISM="Compsopogon coeruleus, Strain SAG 36.94" /LENGTH=415 /DNA_ID=CAMNT_0027147755 /DNA_START=231 /DNA_END=1478 /DNA_ORIENTATION=-
MGLYLSTPNIRKESEDGDGRMLRYGVSEMQGWRLEMEDAHVAVLGLMGDDKSGLFAVFDGHGGAEVARFSRNHIQDEIVKLPEFQGGHYQEALRTVFHRIDEMLEDVSYHEEIRQLMNGAAAGTRDEVRPNGEPTTGDQHPGEPNGDKAKEAPGGPWQPQMLIPGEDRIPIRDVLTMFQTLQNAKDSPEDNSKAIVLSYDQSTAGNAGESPPPDSGSSQSHTVASGCTSIVVLVRDNQVVCANAGDSMAVLCRSGKAIDLSFPHKPFDEKERKRIESAGGFVSDQGRVNNNLNLSRSIGDLKYKQNRAVARKDQIISAEPDFVHLEICPEDEFIIVACDGIWDVVQPQEAVDFVRERWNSTTKLSSICEQLLDRCITEDPHVTGGLGGDNMTCLIVSLRELTADNLETDAQRTED